MNTCTLEGITFYLARKKLFKAFSSGCCRDSGNVHNDKRITVDRVFFTRKSLRLLNIRLHIQYVFVLTNDKKLSDLQ